jgi:5'-nucleotidase
VHRSRTALLLTLALAVAAAAAACGDKRRRAPPPEAPPTVISIVSTNDLHGHLESLPVLAGYLANLRAKRTVLLVDAGDMLQGTMESSLNEGEAAIRAYNAIGYAAAAIGNHDFDFGPVGPGVEPDARSNPHGALEARARQARFPFLSANITDEKTGKLIAWDNVRPSVLLETGGLRVGLIGVATETMPWVVRPSHFQGLRVDSISAALPREAAQLRRAGAQVVIGIAHAGGRCASFDDPVELSSCDLDGEIFRIAQGVAPGTVDVLIGGHKHQGVAHRVNGIAVVQAYARGRAFSRVDLTVSHDGKVSSQIFPPRDLCSQPATEPGCTPGSYEGAPVHPDETIAKMLAADMAAAAILSDEPLGVRVESAITRSQTAESPLGNLLVDLMLAARPEHDIAIQNGGALRADLPAGELTYGQLYEAMSFDNHFATLEVTAGALRRDLSTAFATSGDVVSVSGMRVAAQCQGDTLEVSLRRNDGTDIADDERLRVLTSDYLAIGGDGLFGVQTLRAATVSFDDGIMLRDAMATALRKRGGTLRADATFDPEDRRVIYPAPPPLRCPEPAR